RAAADLDRVRPGPVAIARCFVLKVLRRRAALDASCRSGRRLLETSPGILKYHLLLQEVQSLLLNWKGPDLTTYGELVLEGTFKVHRAKNERTLFLFDRMLLITKRRREHFVYKTHISCSTLMLIESAKDSLCFSVTHYKHPKQPHTVQAKTVEERKLWAHHIKRIILENHHAIIPQKVQYH
uniref:LOW QUALITY PROTEIN: pleckstrin homology domain-containing family G member 3-like n=1 Tax=Centroberyx gerrardi TaxID=166262 RepID=UPI003AAB0B46